MNNNELPLVFHGTNYEFQQFENRHLGKACRNPTTEFGFFFSENEEDALSWAIREQERCITVPRNARVIEARLKLNKVKDISYPKFRFYLQRAKTSTIQRDMKSWIADGFDGLTVVREGHRWFAAFNTDAIEIVGIKPVPR